MIFFTKLDLHNLAFESLCLQIIRVWKLLFRQLQPTFLANFYAGNGKPLFCFVDTSFLYLSMHPWQEKLVSPIYIETCDTFFSKAKLKLASNRFFVQLKCPLEITPVSCVATVAVSNRDKLLMQNLTPANINLISGYENHCLLFLKTLLPPIVTFTSSKKYYSTNPSFRPVKNYFLSSENSILLFGTFLLLLETMIEIRENKF